MMNPLIRRPTARLILNVSVIALLILLTACRSGRREDPLLRLSSDEALEQGKVFTEQGKHHKARRLFTHAFEVEPNSRSGREALLLAADAYYLQGGTDNFIKCEAKYRDFLNRFPTSARSDYAQYQIGNCLASRIEKPDRDQKFTKQALDAYQELLRLYPTSPYIEEVRGKIVEVIDNLAAHELVIGRFYQTYGRGVCTATIRRLEYLQETYPDFSQMDEALFLLARAYWKCRRPEDAEATYETLRDHYPESSFVAELEKERKKWDDAS